MGEALAAEATSPIDTSIRMLQAARWAASAEVTAGFEPGSVEQAYLRAREEALALASDDPFVTSILAFVPPGTTWKGTMTELTKLLVAHGEERDSDTGKATKKLPRDFPTTTAAVRSAFNRKQPALRQLGLEIVKKAERTATSSKTTMITLVRKAEPVVAATTDDVSGNPVPPTTNGAAHTLIPDAYTQMMLDAL